MRVLYISEHFVSIGKGTSTYNMNIAKNISNLGMETFLIADAPESFSRRDNWVYFNNYKLFIPSKK